MTSEYFDELMVNRGRLAYAIATRRQLERWEPFVADYVSEMWDHGREPSGLDLWAGEMEHHFALVAANNLLRALDLDPAWGCPLDEVVRAELKEGRDLHEHWDENMPVFNVWPRPREPGHAPGKSFAKRNPDVSPYDHLRFSPNTGPQLTPNVPASVVHGLVDAVEADVLAKDASYSEYVPLRAASPWVHESGEWWPRSLEWEVSRSTDHIADHAPSDEDTADAETA